MAGPIKRTKLADRAYGSIRDSILRGDFAEGTRLAETRLSELLGISRAPVREALNRLASVGLVTTSPHRGAQVIELSHADIVELHEVSAGLQATATRLFVARGADPTPLRGAVAQMAEAAAAAADREHIYRELDFQRAIAEESGNELIRHLFLDLSGPLVLALTKDPTRPARAAAIVALYTEILTAIEAGDVPQATALIGRRSAADLTAIAADGRPAGAIT